MDAQTTKVLLDLDQMMKTPGWIRLRQDFSFKIHALQNEINEPGQNTVMYSEGDLKKIELRTLTSILSYPDSIINLLNSKPQTEQLDPFKDASDLPDDEDEY